MHLTELAEALTQYLNDHKDEWSTEQINAKTELDPDKCLLNELGVYVVPEYVIYTLQSGARSRGARNQVVETLRVALIVSRVFQEMRAASSDGVTNWEEAKPLLDMRQDAERVLIGYGDSTLTLSDVDPSPIEELELDHRNFVAITSFGWEQVSCVSPFDSSLTSSVSSRSTGRAPTGDSIRSRLSSAARQGRG